MVIRAAILVGLAIFLAGAGPLRNPTSQLAQNDGYNDKAVMKAEADRQFNAARFFAEKGEHSAAINRFKTIIMEY